jgi:hypothetical protein
MTNVSLRKPPAKGSRPAKYPFSTKAFYREPPPGGELALATFAFG